MRYLFILPLAVTGALGVCLLAQVPEGCCEMKIVTTSASPSVLTITIANLNQPMVTLVQTSPERDFRARVTTDIGQEVNRTEHGRRLLTQEREEYRRIGRQLKRGDTFTETLDLRPLFELKSGTYNVALSRDVFVGESKVSVEGSVSIRIP
jgi:hypothetical protein